MRVRVRVRVRVGGSTPSRLLRAILITCCSLLMIFVPPLTSIVTPIGVSVIVVAAMAIANVIVAVAGAVALAGG